MRGEAASIVVGPAGGSSRVDGSRGAGAGRIPSEGGSRFLTNQVGWTVSGIAREGNE